MSNILCQVCTSEMKLDFYGTLTCLKMSASPRTTACNEILFLLDNVYIYAASSFQDHCLVLDHVIGNSVL